MTFIQASAPTGQRSVSPLSADNGYPDRHIVMETLRTAAPLLGLRAPVLATLDALLSCLPPKRTHHTVFASNATLTFRRNGISDRTLRRHVALLQDAGLLTRHDSPNRKRYSRHNREDGMALRFGFDLTPLFRRMTELVRVACDARTLQERIAYLTCKIRAAANDLLMSDPKHEAAALARAALRRKLTVSECEALLEGLEQTPAEGASDPGETMDMTGRNGQNVRHHQNSTKENIDRTAETSTQPSRQDTSPPDQGREIPVNEIVRLCPEAAQFEQAPTETVGDVVAHARFLAPMMGIDACSYDAARSRLGETGAALTVWGLMQIQHRIRKLGAYFRSITSGARSDGFDPIGLILSLDRERIPTT
ncbi:plasmid replication protein RepC [Salipiger thiooxidans]|uniref:plasmid replication protein RepC n=1 Tax=Salipiger thiooxidans TaxID=282683 RepID=UPI001F621AD6|nr:plasmid replication protein RepC [Salipiger thiooxidans]